MDKTLDKLKAGGKFIVSHLRDGKIIDKWEEHNLVVTEGLNYLIGTALDGATTQITSWYVGLFSGAYTPVATDTAANIASNATEFSDFDETERQAWTPVLSPLVPSITVQAGQPSISMQTEPSTVLFLSRAMSLMVLRGLCLLRLALTPLKMFQAAISS